MSATRLPLLLVMLLLPLTPATADALHSYVPKDGFVPNGTVAVAIADAVLTAIYGNDVIGAERPLQASLAGDVWTVTGAPPKPGWRGGVAHVEIAKTDGRILRVTHGR